MKGLVFLKPNGSHMEPFTTSDIIADCAGVQRATVSRLVRKHQKDLEEFGQVGFEIRAVKKGKAMINLTIFEFKHKAVVNSRDVAEIVSKPHYDLIKSIRQFCKYLTDGKIPVSEFFINATYQDSTGRELPCFLCTRKGCDMIANKLTGRKGVLFTAAYVARFHEMETELEKRKVLRQMSKPIRRNLTDALRDSGEDERMHGHSYATYTDLLYRAALGKTAKQLRNERGAAPRANAKGFLTSEELPLYEKKEAAATVLLDAGLRYDEIKKIIMREAQKN